MITVYSKPNCPYCDQAKIWLEKNNLEFITVDVTEDLEALEFLKEKGHRSVPQIYQEKNLLVEGGFNGLKELNREEILRRKENANRQ